jgi:hypothetical protein
MDLNNDVIAKQLSSIPNDGDDEQAVVEKEEVNEDINPEDISNQLSNIEDDTLEEVSASIVDTVAVSNVPEEHELKEQTEKLLAPSQDNLYNQYSEKYPELFDNGKLVDYDAAKELGIVNEVSPVARDDEGVTAGHISTKSDAIPFGFTYNTESQAVAVQKQNAKNEMDFRRIEKLDEDFEVPEMTAKEEDKFITDMVNSMPDTNEDGSTNLMKKFLNITGSPGYKVLNALGYGMNYLGASYQDVIEKVAKETQEAFPDAYDSAIGISPKDFASKMGRGTMAGIEFLETVPVLGNVVKFPTASARVSRRLAAELAKKKQKAVKDWNRRLNAQKMKGATAQQLKEKQDEARKVANQNKEIANQLITEFEKSTGKTISKTSKTGQKTLDYNLAREAGIDTAVDITESKGASLADKVLEEVTGSAKISDDARLFGQGDTLLQPILKPEKFDGIVAVASDLKKANPEAFKNNKTIIDNLFELTVNKQLIAGDKLIDMLNKYDVSFEDYVLTVVGSGSTAGKVLNKLSQIKRARPVNEMVALQQAATLKNQDVIRNTIMRVENIRRGGLVSQIATASRNLTSAGIRAPMEGLGNVVDTALYNLSNEGVLSGAKSLLSPNNWRDSFRHMRYMFENPKETKEVVDFILDRPELAGQSDLLFNNINEIMIATGRGRGGILDKVLTEGEDAVQALNIPNRWQEFLVRRGAFLGELERLTKREYGIDLIDALNDGKIRDLLNDASSVRPSGARSFTEIVADATNKALDVTYAKQPDIPVFRSASNFIVRNGLTVVMPFPRFMFNSMELMGQYAGGALLPLSRKVANIVTLGKVGKGKLTAKDRQRISRNVVGSFVGAPVGAVTVGKLLETDEEGVRKDISNGLLGIAAIGAAYQYRTSDDAPADYKEMKVDDDTVANITPQFPMRQFLYLGETLKQIKNGTFYDFFDSKEFVETFAGTNFRTGVGQSIFQDISDIISSADLTDKEAGAKALARPIGEYLSSWLVPFAQVIEAQRASGNRGLTYKDLQEDPDLNFGTTFMKELGKPFRQRGFTVTPEEEEAAPKREYLFAEERKRVSPLSRLFLGVNLTTKDSLEGEYLKKLGFTEYDLGSKSKVPTVKRFENKILREALPEIVRAVKIRENTVRKEYINSPKSVKDKFSEQDYVNSDIKPLIKARLNKVRAGLSDIKTGQSSDYIKALVEFRKLPKDFRRRAMTKYVDLNNKEPDASNAKDLAALTTIGKTFRKAFNK